LTNKGNVPSNTTEHYI